MQDGARLSVREIPPVQTSQSHAAGALPAYIQKRLKTHDLGLAHAASASSMAFPHSAVDRVGQDGMGWRRM